MRFSKVFFQNHVCRVYKNPLQKLFAVSAQTPFVYGLWKYNTWRQIWRGLDFASAYLRFFEPPNKISGIYIHGRRSSALLCIGYYWLTVWQ